MKIKISKEIIEKYCDANCEIKILDKKNLGVDLE